MASCSRNATSALPTVNGNTNRHGETTFARFLQYTLAAGFPGLRLPRRFEELLLDAAPRDLRAEPEEPPPPVEHHHPIVRQETGLEKDEDMLAFCL